MNNQCSSNLFNFSPRHTHDRCTVRDIFCNDCASTDGDIVADGNRSKDCGASANVAVVTNRYLPIGKVWTFLANENHRENSAITPYFFCSTKYMTETVMNKMETRTNVIGGYCYIIFLRKPTPTKPTQCIC